MIGLDLHTMLSEYEQIFIEYLALLNSFGEVSGTNRILPNVKASTDSPNTTNPTGISSSDACWASCNNATGCIASVYQSGTTPTCTLYNEPSTNTGYITYVDASGYTSVVSNSDYYKYNLLLLNSQLLQYSSSISEAIDNSDYSEKQMVAMHAIKANLTSQSIKLQEERQQLLNATNSADTEYNVTYMKTESNYEMMYIWAIVTWIAIFCAMYMCFIVLKEQQQE